MENSNVKTDLPKPEGVGKYYEDSYAERCFASFTYQRASWLSPDLFRGTCNQAVEHLFELRKMGIKEIKGMKIGIKPDWFPVDRYEQVDPTTAMLLIGKKEKQDN